MITLEAKLYYRRVQGFVFLGTRENFNVCIRETRRRSVLEALTRSGGNRQLPANLLEVPRYTMKKHITTLGSICR